MSKFRAVSTQKVYVEIMEQLKGLIESGELKNGEKLPPERLLAAELGTSRPTLREALAALEMLGYVEIVNGKGTFIRYDPGRKSSVDVESLFDLEDSPFQLMEVRKAVEPAAAALAAERITREELDELAEIMRRMDEVYATTGQFPSADDVLFHLRVAHATHNAVFFEVMKVIAERMGHPLWNVLKGKSHRQAGHSEAYLAEHRAVLNALRAGNVKQAHDAMTEHLERIEQDLLAE